MLTTVMFSTERSSSVISLTLETHWSVTPAELTIRDEPSACSPSSSNSAVSTTVTVAPVSTMKSYGPAPFSFTATTERLPLYGRRDTVAVCRDCADPGTAANESRTPTLRRAQNRVRLFMAVVSDFLKESGFDCLHSLKRKRTSSRANVFRTLRGILRWTEFFS